MNECGADNGGCEHFCRNEAGTHSCYCRVGYILNTDGIHCDGTLLVFLPPANEVFTPVDQSFFPQGEGCVPQHVPTYTPRSRLHSRKSPTPPEVTYTPRSHLHPHNSPTPPPLRWPLKQTVRILLECIPKCLEFRSPFDQFIRPQLAHGA